MTLSSANPPVILSFSVLDPSGTGGIQANIETAASLGCHCAPIITAICTSGAAPDSDIVALDPTIIIEQARSVIEEMDVQAISIGFLGSLQITEAIHSILRDCDNIPVVTHPSLCFIDKENREHSEIKDAFTNLILPQANIANFSLFEARDIAKETDTVDTTAHAIISTGCDIAVITGTQAVQNSVFDAKGLVKNYRWEQEPANCHGASSTLTMAMACYLGHGFSESQAIEQAHNFTWQTMRTSRDLGFDRRTPHRLYWADKNIETSDDTPPSTLTH
ncbi:MAG: bifunctional hydroxymethylpyrimidine kinase/phosphomethylpyrimidine kinase [Agarilytica sp.]